MENEVLIERLTKNEEAVKSAQYQINEMKELINSIHSLAGEVKYMRVDLNKLQCEIDRVKSTPLKRYEMAITAVISTVISVIIGFVASAVL